jgi:hypothetical protein
MLLRCEPVEGCARPHQKISRSALNGRHSVCMYGATGAAYSVCGVRRDQQPSPAATINTQNSSTSTIYTKNSMDSITAAAVLVATAPFVNSLKGFHPPGCTLNDGQSDFAMIRPLHSRGAPLLGINGQGLHRRPSGSFHDTTT